MATRLPNITDQQSSPTIPGIDKNTSSLDNAGAHTARIPEESGRADHIGSLSTDAETLLKALWDVIIPCVRPADGESNRNAHQNALGPNGEEFIVALQKFMSSFLRSYQGPVGGVEVELEETGENIPNAGSLNPASNASHNTSSTNIVSAEVPPDTEPLPSRPLPERNPTSQESIELISEVRHKNESSDISRVSSIDSMDIEDADTPERRRKQSLKKVLDALRDHVFNTMPIRLLCYTPGASKLRITLLERSEIYAQIASKLTNSFNFSEVSLERVEEPGGIKKLILEYSKYAILSHTWLRDAPGEVTYGDWIRGDFKAQYLGYRKLLNFSRAAWKDHKVTFGWMDTICINKESSAELDESIRSMYKWYRDADVCITYLAGTETLSDIHKDAWFTRGWTLQELLAPSRIQFYNTRWNKLSNSLIMKDGEDPIILKQIEYATTITKSELSGTIGLLSIPRRMQMAANRQVTREEDIAYCLMGIFDVGISIAYGEGSDSAFSRLLKEIFSSSDVMLDIVNWAGPFASRISHLLPRTPQGYLHRSSNEQLNLRVKPIEPMILTNVGLRITMVLMPAISIRWNPATRYYGPHGDYHALINIAPLSNYTIPSKDVVGGTYSVLDARVSKYDGWKERHKWNQLTLGILNVVAGNDDSEISLPGCCLAVALHHTPSNTSKIPTEAPIVFNLNNFKRLDEPAQSLYHVKRSELGAHAMRLVTLDL